MPTYRFRCPKGHEVELTTRPMAEGEVLQGAKCEVCGGELVKVFTRPEVIGIRGCWTQGPRT